MTIVSVRLPCLLDWRRRALQKHLKILSINHCIIVMSIARHGVGAQEHSVWGTRPSVAPLS